MADNLFNFPLNQLRQMLHLSDLYATGTHFKSFQVFMLVKSICNQIVVDHIHLHSLPVYENCNGESVKDFLQWIQM